MKQRNITAIVCYLTLGVIGITMLMPFVWMLLTSLKSENEVFSDNILPQETILGENGDKLRYIDDKVILSQNGQPYIVDKGNPIIGNMGEVVRDENGRFLYEKDGQPIYCKQLKINTQTGLVYNTKRYDYVYDFNKEPLILTKKRMQELKRNPYSHAILKNSNDKKIKRDNGSYVRCNDIIYTKIGKPIRDNKAFAPLRNSNGTIIQYRARFPFYKGDNEPLTNYLGKDLIDFKGNKIFGHMVKKIKKNRFIWSNYKRVWVEVNFNLFAFNSIFVAITITIVQVFTSSLSGFAFSRLKWPGRDKIFLLYLSTMMIPGMVTILPKYLIIKELAWIDTFNALIIPASFSAYGTFMMRQFMMSLPRSLEEAAMIDGASIFKIYWDIVMPLSKPAIITLTILTFIGSWQSFTWPLIATYSESTRVLPVALKVFDSDYGTNYSLLMTGSVIMILPCVLIFLYAQKFFVKGLQLGGVKE